MSIWGIMPNMNVSEAANVKSTHKSVSNGLHNYNGPSFSESMSSVARSANMQIAHGSDAAALQLSRRKEETDEKLFSFLETEEEILEDSIGRIAKLLKDLQK